MRKALLALILAGLMAWPAAADTWQTQEIRTSFYFRPGPAESLGLEIREVREAAKPFEHNLYSAARGKDVAFESLGPLGIGAEIENGRLFTRLAGGVVPHRGGFVLGYKGGEVSLQGFVLASSAAPRTFEIRTAAGELVFTGDLAHFELDRAQGRLRVFNIDLRVSKELARRLGSPDYEGMAVGVLTLDARILVPALATALTPEGGTPPACGDWSGQQDVALLNIPTIGQAERDTAGARVGITPSAALKNVGTANVPWQFKFSGTFPPYGTSQHPYLVWALYRVANGRIEQLGISDVKHAFLTINNNCDDGACTDDQILGQGCEDIYGEGNNEDEFSLSYRSEITAHTGVWPSQGSHFDQDNNNTQDHPPGNEDPPFAHRMMISEADLQTAGANYYLEAWYVVRDDINIFNSMGYRRTIPSFNSGTGTWTFNLPNAFQQGSALATWVDPNSPGSGNAIQVLDTGVGRVRLAAKTTSLGGGLWRYDYALMNHDLDRQVGSFRIPLDGASATSAYFRDVDGNAANNWTAAITGAAITWTRTGATGLDWGTMYNFGFVSNTAPTDAAAVLTPVEAGGPATYSIATKAPTAGSLIFVDGFETGSTGAWSLTTP